MLTPNGFRAVSPEAPVTPANSSETFPQHSTSAPSPSYISTDACLASQAAPALQAAAVDHDESTSPTSTGSVSHEPVQSADHAADQSADESVQSLDRRAESDPGMNMSLQPLHRTFDHWMLATLLASSCLLCELIQRLGAPCGSMFVVLATRPVGVAAGVTATAAGSASGSLSESADEAGPNPKAEVEEVLRMALAWLRRADPYGFPAAGGNSEPGAAGRPPAGHKVGYLLSGTRESMFRAYTE